MKFQDLTGQVFNRLTVVSKVETKGRTAWLCQCECGITKIIKAESLKDGSTKSCGCLNKEKRIARAGNMYAGCVKYHPSETSARRVWRKRYNDGISFEDFLRISQMNCYYCEAAPNNEQNAAMEDKKSSQFAKDNGTFIYNGLDRTDSSKLHTIDNVVPCCKWCNYAKRERSVEEFEIWIEQIYKGLQKRKGS
jgi:hypothetical protein